jgi:hypothetical protein
MDLAQTRRALVIDLPWIAELLNLSPPIPVLPVTTQTSARGRTGWGSWRPVFRVMSTSDAAHRMASGDPRLQPGEIQALQGASSRTQPERINDVNPPEAQ